jgi:hypothetical protein
VSLPSNERITKLNGSKSDDLLRHWREFETRYSSEEECVEALFQILGSLEKTGCRNCGTLAVERDYGARVGKCNTCRKHFSFTSGTFFERVRLVRPWLAAAWFLERGTAISTKLFHELVGVAYSTAWMIHRKMALVIQSIMDREKKSFVLIASEVFANVICRRSRETPARQHPHAEQLEFEKNSLSQAKPKMEWQVSQCHSRPALPCATQLLRDAFHGISRKYLQIYLAELWCGSDRRCWPGGRLLKECSRHPIIREDEVLSFISPLLVKMY